MSDLGHFVDDRNNQIFKLKAKLKGAEAEILRLSGKTGFCSQCEAYAKEIEELKVDCIERQQEINCLRMEPCQLAPCVEARRVLKEKAEAFGEALEKIKYVTVFGRPNGLIVTSEHYEGAYLDCVEIAKSVLSRFGEEKK